MTRRIWGTSEEMPFTDAVMQASASAGASEIIHIPCAAIPSLSAGLNVIPPAEVYLAELKSTQANAIEAAVMDVYARPVALAREYELREADAIAFRDGGYVGTPGRVLLGFAVAKGYTNAQAADAVIAQGTAFRGAELTLADLRMRKYEILRAATEQEATTTFNTAMATIKQIAAAIA